MAILLATTCPERVESLSLYGTYAVGGGAKPDDPAPPTIDPEREALLALLPQVWGTGVALRDSGLVAHADEAPEGLGAHFERNACTPHMIAEIMRRNYEIDVRPILSTVHVPTLVMHASGDPVVNVAYGRHLAEHIDGARYVELPLVMHTSWRAEDYETLLDTVLEFVAGARSRFASERVLATVMFTDIVESTRRAAQIGDRRWNVLLDEHDLRSRQLVASFGGQVVKHTGDGMLATFDGPARAVQCAQDLRDALAGAGVPIRAGLHTGEVERRQRRPRGHSRPHRCPRRGVGQRGRGPRVAHGPRSRCGIRPRLRRPRRSRAERCPRRLADLRRLLIAIDVLVEVGSGVPPYAGRLPPFGTRGAESGTRWICPGRQFGAPIEITWLPELQDDSPGDAFTGFMAEAPIVHHEVTRLMFTAADNRVLAFFTRRRTGVTSVTQSVSFGTSISPNVFAEAA